MTTTRALEGDAAAVTIEAEAGSRHGTASTTTLGSSTGTNASGSAFVGWIGNGAGNYLELARQAGFDTAGSYDVVVSYANAELKGNHAYNPQVVDRKLEVVEAGVGVAGSAYFRYTYSWNSFWERTIPVTLTTADAPLRLGNPSAFAPNLDRITIAPVVIGTPTTVQFEIE